jgi:glutamate/tyrosine decarboxylase-like PLP-dependent enzyme
VVGTAGTTTVGAIDPLPEMAAFCRREGLWFHVDAAWGGGAAMSPKLRPHLAGIESADSITCDAHKWLSVSMGAGMFFCRHPKAAENAFTIDAPYVLDALRGAADPYVESLQWSRRFIGLKVFMTLAELGAPGMAAMIEGQAAMGDRLREKLRERGWIVLGETPFPLVCFTHPEIRAGTASPDSVLRSVYRGRQAWISEARFQGREPALRACITSFKTSAADLEILVDEIDRGLAEAAARSS